MLDDPQKTWDDYYDRIKRRRLAAAALLWDEIEAAGADEETIFALDFAHFGNNRDDVDDLARQLSENYTTEASVRSEQNYLGCQKYNTTRRYLFHKIRAHRMG